MQKVASRAGAFGMGAAMHRHTGSGKPVIGHKLLNAKKAVLAGSMTSAFAAAHEKRQSDRLTKTSSRKSKLKMMVSEASSVSLFKAVSADAHARDYSQKEWQKHTKSLSGHALFDALWPPVPGFPCEKAMKVSSMNKLVSKIYEQVSDFRAIFSRLCVYLEADFR